MDFREMMAWGATLEDLMAAAGVSQEDLVEDEE